MVQCAEKSFVSANFARMLTSGPVTLMHSPFQGDRKWAGLKRTGTTQAGRWCDQEANQI